MGVDKVGDGLTRHGDAPLADLGVVVVPALASLLPDSAEVRDELVRDLGVPESSGASAAVNEP